MVEGSFGAVIFGRARGRIHTFEEVERKYSGRFASHMVHLRKPLLEWAGNDLVKIDVRISLNSSWCGDPLPILDLWHRLHETALAATLIIGNKPMGPGLSMFVITELRERHKHWLPRGRLISVELDVHFDEYIPFTEGGAITAGGALGFNTAGAISSAIGNITGGVII